VFLRAGDVASARLFFQRAADAGDSRAAMRMAVTFDVGFLDRAGVHGLRGDPERQPFGIGECGISKRPRPNSGQLPRLNRRLRSAEKQDEGSSVRRPLHDGPQGKGIAFASHWVTVGGAGEAVESGIASGMEGPSHYDDDRKIDSLALHIRTSLWTVGRADGWNIEASIHERFLEEGYDERSGR
jgi:hypothetical protein